jgi:hypothetical protein
MSNSVAFLAEGKLFLRDSAANAESRLIESPFVQQQLDRAAQQRQRNEWKGDNQMLWGGMSGPGLLSGRVAPVADGDARKVRMTALAAGPEPGQVIYALQSGSVGGLFVWNETDKTEKRLFHRNQFAAGDISVHPTAGTLVLSVQGDSGTANIATMELTGRGMRELTEGDSLDESPSWAPPAAMNGRKVIVYQSAGVGRNAAGFPVSRSAYEIMQLDLERGEVETLVEDAQFDHLLPRIADDGSLLFIRRPYEPFGQPASPLKVALDVVLFPFRLVMAFVHFFNWFSIVFRRKPLITASGPKKEGPDARYLMLWGKLIDAEKVIRGSGGKDANAALVPKSWELVRRSTGGEEKVLATSVLSFDLGADGTITYSDGSGVYRIDSSGESTRICSGKLIERVVSFLDNPGR